MKMQSYYAPSDAPMSNKYDQINDISVNCVGAVDDSFSFHTSFSRLDYYLIYILSGKMDITFNKEKNVISAGEFLIIAPKTNYLYKSEKGSGMNYLWLHFSGKKSADILKKYAVPVNRITPCRNTDDISALWIRMFHEFMINDDFFSDMTAAVFYEIIAFLSRNANKPQGSKDLLRSISYIHENYNKNIPISMLAKKEKLSESRYRAVFSSATGISPGNYITNRRIDAAKELLEKTDKPLYQISSLCGYNDVYYFGRIFKKKTGISPGNYRRMKNEQKKW